MNKMNKLIFLIVILLSVALISIYLMPINDIDIKSILLNNTKQLESYSLNVNLEYEITINNESVSYNNKIFSHIDMDLINKLMFIDSSVISLSSGQQKNIKTKTYVDGNLVYSKINGIWESFPITSDIWNNNDQIIDLISDIESSEIKRLSDEKLNGVYYYAFSLYPNMDLVKDKLIRDLGGDSNIVESEILNYEKNILIDKDTFNIVNVDENVLIKFFPKDVRSINKIETLIVNYKNKLNFYNINNDIIFDLPSDLKLTLNGSDISDSPLVANVFAEIK
ncbi:hypothetical protein HOK68_03315 [Candidatus Woesearchaeota archaeon]|jgi:hypothetical protein|nr:hypothetical protein [Candidatus Woesearchaeota archaeon]MBT4387732.1 hypothetical protein [Candidatus Woesearchaeota archaeon]MBT4595551.1 hypothetical protein [Candidatus Woesearchaeota archaeon]MBT5740966.1 hypothetical protein [Candidatus Woesearchaeota archaeon]MBT6505783.1 hypothetical protein [Candidatus Woesearchaeota archaeon]